MSSPSARLVSLIASALLVTGLFAFAPVAEAQVEPPRWRGLQVPETGTFGRWFFPGGEITTPRPAVVFLHGSGGTPFDYEPFLGDPAEAAGVIVIVPKSRDPLQWGVRDGAVDDPITIAAALERVAAEVAIDLEQVSVAGHSDGGAYAAQIAFGPDSPLRARWAGVFQLSAPYRPPAEPALDAYVPPVRMYYGTADPNYVTAYPRYVAYWQSAGVPFEEDVRLGAGHSTWPTESMTQGFEFLADQRRVQDDGGGNDGGDDGGGDDGGGDDGGGDDGDDGGDTPDPCDDDAVLCLHDGRFHVEVTWRDFENRTGVARVVALDDTSHDASSDEAGMLWFFGPDNWELLVKVLDACALNARFWVFAAATTDVEYELRVTDTEADGLVRRYTNSLGDAAPAVTDTDAFATCDVP